MQHKKALLAAAVSAALLVSANASAEVKVYGKIHTSIAAVSQEVKPAAKTSSNEIKSNASRIGFKSGKEMANGMTVTGQAEFQIDWVGDVTKSSDDLISLRNTYVGLKGGFGEVRVGRHDSPHKISTAKLDVFGDTYGDYNNIITVDNRLSNVIAYMNKFGDIGVAAAYDAGADKVDGENKGSATSIMVNYSSGPLYASVAVESFSDTVADDLKSATKLGLGYGFGPAYLGLVHQTLSYDGTKKDETESYLSAKFKASDVIDIKAAYGMRDDDLPGDDEVLSAIGMDYKMDKDAKFYVLYANGSDNGMSKSGKLKGDASALSMGIEYKF